MSSLILSRLQALEGRVKAEKCRCKVFALLPSGAEIPIYSFPESKPMSMIVDLGYGFIPTTVQSIVDKQSLV